MKGKMSEESEIEEKLRECEKKLGEMERLKLVEQSVIIGLREGGFSEKALELFRYRKNFLTQIPSGYKADTVGSFTGSCGDRVDIYLKIEEDAIKGMKYTTDGCPGAVTSASALTELAIGKKLKEVRKLTVNSVVEYLKEGPKGLPKNMHDCCVIAVGSLRDAVNKFKLKKYKSKYL